MAEPRPLYTHHPTVVPTDSYLIPRTKLLTAVEEVALAERIQNGRKVFDMVRKQKCNYRCTHRQRLLDSIPDAVAARNELVARNIPWVITNAADFTGYGLMAMITEGILGLTRAAELYVPEKKRTRFSTYATKWITQGMRRFGPVLYSQISMPVEHHRQRKIAAAYLLQQERLGNLVTDEQLADELGVRKELARELRWSLLPPVYLGQAVPGSDGATFLDRLRNPTVMKNNLGEQVSAEVAAALSQLSRPERQVLDLRYLRSTLSRQGTAEELGVTHQWVREVELSALAKLRKIIAPTMVAKTG